MDSITHIELTKQRLIQWMIREGCSRTLAKNTVKSYHSELAEFDKRAIPNEFTKPDCNEQSNYSLHRVILATDAMGMGANNSDVRMVIQYRLPSSMCTLMQRAGRAARAPRHFRPTTERNQSDASQEDDS